MVSVKPQRMLVKKVKIPLLPFLLLRDKIENLIEVQNDLTIPSLNLLPLGLRK